MSADRSGTVQALYQYPVKSIAGNALQSCRVTDIGLAQDRQWLIVDQTGRFVTQRQIPHLVWITARLTPSHLILAAPNQPDLEVAIQNVLSPHRSMDADLTLRSVRIWNDTVMAIDCGEAAQSWLNKFLEVPNKSFHLVEFAPDSVRMTDTNGTALAPTPQHFSDGYGLNILGESSIVELNDRLAPLGQEPIDALRFRPNIVLSGLDAHEEDYLENITIFTHQGDITLNMVKPCTRCNIPDIDPYTAMQTPAVNQTLAGYRRLARMDDAICFGMNAVLTQGAGKLIQVGDRFEARIRI